MIIEFNIKTKDFGLKPAKCQIFNNYALSIRTPFGRRVGLVMTLLTWALARNIKLYILFYTKLIIKPLKWLIKQYILSNPRLKSWATNEICKQ